MVYPLTITIDITPLPLDVGSGAVIVGSPSAGGLACFVGTTRGMTAGGVGVARLEFDAHVPLARAQLARAAAAAQVAAGGALVGVYVAHRLGAVGVGEAAVVVWVSSPHRAEAIEGVRFMIDKLKESAPIWKREVLVDGTASWRANSESGTCCG